MRKERRNKEGIKVGIIGIMINLSLAITKVILSLITNSVSIMADALNNITDTTSSLLTIIGFKIGNKKPTKLHPYGYARYEYISSFLISIFYKYTHIVLTFENFLMFGFEMPWGTKTKKVHLGGFSTKMYQKI